MLYIVANSKLANSHNLQDMNYFLVLGFGQVTADGRKAMHKSPPCISTGVLNKKTTFRRHISWKLSMFTYWAGCTVAKFRYSMYNTRRDMNYFPPFRSSILVKSRQTADNRRQTDRK